ncbi:MAG: hypothetical protein COA96_15145 [SAR86 cluster bacterium]|uniref:CPXCG motif-containing cysteine-rich protein n=1 Tax=SAR86 cluster bacterium TaxID=2030880 RepID=A0A2A5ARK6_9GAMM|nr:MAG: hypothetical protein COA96_15145 [SAR86 cluster bacterium]
MVESHCPCCGEAIQLLIDCSVLQQEYIEDCQVCCRPMTILATIDPEGLAVVKVTAEDEL